MVLREGPQIWIPCQNPTTPPNFTIFVAVVPSYLSIHEKINDLGSVIVAMFHSFPFSTPSHPHATIVCTHFDAER
jgi:hypothetical protein